MSAAIRRRCSNPGCHHHAELDVSRLPDDATFNDLQPRMLCTVCGHRGADARRRSLAIGKLKRPQGIFRRQKLPRGLRVKIECMHSPAPVVRS